VSFDLMGSGRWRFQRQMEQSFKMNEEIFGEDSEEMLQMRDLFANTHPYLLTGTYVPKLFRTACSAHMIARVHPLPTLLCLADVVLIESIDDTIV
jgi:hypothetical protein